MSTWPRRRTVADVMTSKVHVAGPQTEFKLLVRLIEENRVSAIPIVDQEGVPVGIVSEADLLLKERRADFESRDLLHPRRHRDGKVKAGGLVAQDLMTSPAITVGADASLARAARLMQDRNVRRLIVVDERGRIAGIVSRSDLLQIFLRGDEELKEDIVQGLLPTMLLDADPPLEVDVLYNVVTLKGEVDRRSDAEILIRLTREIDGVVDVVDRLTFRWDDAAPARSGPLVTPLLKP